MDIDKNKITSAIYIILLGSVITILIGLSFKHFSIFTPTDPGFQFIIYGISGSILIALLHIAKLEGFIVGFIALLLITFILLKITNLTILFARFILLAALAISILIYHNYYYNKLVSLKFGKFIPLSGLYCIANLIVAILICLIKPPYNNDILLQQSGYGFLIGSGIGIGFELHVPIYKLFNKQ